MKIMLAACLLLLITPASFSQKIVHLPFFEHPGPVIAAGKIKMECVYEYDFSNGSITDSSLASTSIYDTSGRLLKRTVFLNGQVASIAVCTIDTTANTENIRTVYLLKELQAQPFNLQVKSPDTIPGYSKIFYINESNNDTLVYEHGLTAAGLYETTFIKLPGRRSFLSRKNYYEGNRLIKEDLYSSAGKIWYSFIHDYAADGLADSITLIQNGRHYFAGIKTYDAAGRLVKAEGPLPDRNNSFTNKKWNRKKRRVSITYTYNPDKTLAERRYMDDNGNDKMERRKYVTATAQK